MPGSVMLFKELSQILAEAGVSTSQKEHILASIRNRYTPLEEENHEEPKYIPREIERRWTMLDEEKPSEAEIEEHQPDPSCTLEDEQRKFKDLHDAPNFSHELNSQEYMDPIEYWF